MGGVSGRARRNSRFTRQTTCRIAEEYTRAGQFAPQNSRCDFRKSVTNFALAIFPSLCTASGPVSAIWVRIRP